MNIELLQPYLSISMLVISFTLLTEIIKLFAYDEYMNKPVLKRTLLVLAYAGFFSTVPTLFGDNYLVKVTFDIVTLLLFLRYILRFNIKKTALCTAVFCMSISVIETLIVLALSYTIHDFEYSLKTTIGPLTVYCIIFTCFSTVFFLIALIGWIISKKSKKEAIYSKYHLVIFGMALYTVLSEFSVIYLLSDSLSARVNLILFIVGIAAMLINLVVYYLLGLMVKKDEQLMKKSAADMDVSRRLEEYNLTEEKYVSERRQIHEFKNRIQYILELIDKGNFEELRTYASDIKKEDFYSSVHFSTNNPVLDIILNDRYEEAKRRDVKFKAYYNDLSLVTLSRDDAIVLFFNLLDNAIEAAGKCSGEKTVEIKIDASSECTYITVRNTYTGVKRDELRALHSTKDSSGISEEHGFGIYNIKSIVDKYNGTYTDVDHDGVFETYIRLSARDDG